MKQFTLGNYTLDDFADFLNGTPNPQFEGIEGNELIITGKHHINKTININVPMTITGLDAVITGNPNDDFAFSITASNTTIKNVTFKNFRFCIDIDGFGECVENVLIKNVTLDVGITLVDVGSSKSNSILRNIYIEECTAIIGSEKAEKEEYAEFALPFNFCAARYKSGGHIDNCLLENVHVNKCKKKNYSRAGILFMSAMPVGTNYIFTDLSYSNLVIRGINITNNDLDTCWDCGLSITGAFINTGAVLIEDVLLAGNDCRYAIGAVGICGGAHHYGDFGGSVIRGIKIRDNKFTKDSDFCGKTRAICLNASRGDYYNGIVSRNYVIEDVEIYNNVLDGGGVGLYAAHAFLDGDQTHLDNEIRNVSIHHNYITRADVAFYFHGAEADAHQYDWWYGYPDQERPWDDPITDHEKVTYVMERNEIKNLSVTDNIIACYRYRAIASGAWIQGHGMAKDNKVSENIVFKGNKFTRGQDRFDVQGCISYDYTHDEGGNEVSLAFKKNEQ